MENTNMTLDERFAEQKNKEIAEQRWNFAVRKMSGTPLNNRDAYLSAQVAFSLAASAFGLWLVGKELINDDPTSAVEELAGFDRATTSRLQHAMQNIEDLPDHLVHPTDADYLQGAKILHRGLGFIAQEASWSFINRREFAID